MSVTRGNTILPPPRRTGDEKADLASLHEWCADLFQSLAVESNVIGTDEDLQQRVQVLEQKPEPVTTFNERNGDVTLTFGDVTTALGFTPADEASTVSSFNTRTGDVTLTYTDVVTALAFTPANISHTHPASDITSGTLDPARLPAASDMNARLAVQRNGTLIGTRRALNFIPGANVTITTSDDGGAERVNITIAASGGGGGGGSSYFPGGW